MGYHCVAWKRNAPCGTMHATLGEAARHADRAFPGELVKIMSNGGEKVGIAARVCTRCHGQGRIHSRAGPWLACPECREQGYT